MHPNRIILATANPGKAREFEFVMEGVRVEPMPEGAVLPEETGKSYYENARLKAYAVRRYYEDNPAASAVGTPWIMADDSGIKVDALDGAPGIHSARYAGEDATDAENVEKLLGELDENENRRARFVCEIVCLSPEGLEIRATGACDGEITTRPRGSAGFGYDPVFIPDGYMLTFSELPADEKNRISHRARAALSLLEQLGGGES